MMQIKRIVINASPLIDKIYSFRNEYVAYQDQKLIDPELSKQPLLKEGIKIIKFLLFYLGGSSANILLKSLRYDFGVSF